MGYHLWEFKYWQAHWSKITTYHLIKSLHFCAYKIGWGKAKVSLSLFWQHLCFFRSCNERNLLSRNLQNGWFLLMLFIKTGPRCLFVWHHFNLPWNTKIIAHDWWHMITTQYVHIYTLRIPHLSLATATLNTMKPSCTLGVVAYPSCHTFSVVASRRRNSGIRIFSTSLHQAVCPGSDRDNAPARKIRKHHQTSISSNFM